MIKIETGHEFYIDEIPKDADYIASEDFKCLPNLGRNIYKLDDRWTHFNETEIPSYTDEFFEITDIHGNRRDSYEWVCSFSIFFLKKGGMYRSRANAARHEKFIEDVKALVTHPDRADNMLMRFYVSPEVWERLHEKRYLELPDAEFYKMRYPSEDSQIGCVWRMLALFDKEFEWAIQTECETEDWVIARFAHWYQDTIKRWLTSNDSNFALGSEILISNNTFRENWWGILSADARDGIAFWHQFDIAILDFLSSGGITTQPSLMPDVRQVLHRYIAERPIQHVLYHESENRWTAVAGHKNKIEYGWKGWGCGQTLWRFIKKSVPTRHLLYKDSIACIENAKFTPDSAVYRLFSQLMAEGSDFIDIDTHAPIFEPIKGAQGSVKKAFIEFGANVKPNLTPLLQRGWHGILVEPHPTCIPKLLREVREYSADVYCGAIAYGEDFVNFYSKNSETFDRVDREGAVDLHNPGYRSEIFKEMAIKFNPISLEKLIEGSPYPVHRVEVDCEGMEATIFNAYSFKVKPNVFKIACHSDEIRCNLHSVFREHGYTVEDIDAEHILCTIGEVQPDELEIFPTN